jgi:intein/homing endonuclease
MSAWWDYFRLWQYALGTKDPYSAKLDGQRLTGAGVSQPDAIPDIRQDGSFWGGGRGLIRLRDSNDFIDLSSVTNRQSRYKEYERLRNVAEIETAMTVFADESCLSGKTKVSTLFDGVREIRWLAENRADDEFLVYCWDFEKNDYTLGWAYHPRKVKTAMTVRIMLDDGNHITATPDHRILLKNGEWIMAGQLKFGDELMPFYRLPPNKFCNDLKTGQFPRVFTQEGWKTERQFIDEWKSGKRLNEDLQKAIRLITAGLSIPEVAKQAGHTWKTVNNHLHKAGFTYREVKNLGKKESHRRVVGIIPWKELEVFDLSVRDHENFCGESLIFHNCQVNDDGHVLKVETENKQVKEELEFLLFHHKMLNIDKRAWSWAKNLFIFGDLFLELIMDMDNPKDGVLKTMMLPPESMYRIETTKGRLIEFQQSKEGPDTDSLTKAPVTQATDAELQQSTAIRFHPDQIIHSRIGDDRKTFYPYGVSLIEAARGPAHQLRLMEDAMVVYRLCLTGDSRIRTANGWKYIKNIQNDDMVYSYIDGKTVPASVVAHSNNGKQKVYSVKSKHIEIKGNDIHPILVKRGDEIKYVEIKDLRPKKDKLINVTNDNEIPVEIPTIFGEKWAKLSPSQRMSFRNQSYENKSALMRECGDIGRIKQFLYAEGKALPYEQAVEICEKFSLDPDELIIANKGQINPERIDLPKYVNEEFAQLFGFMLGDGSVRENGYQLSFSAGKNDTVNKFYALLLEEYFGKVRFEPEKRPRKTKGLGNYVVDSVIACKIFKEMGYIGGAHNKRIPQWVYNAPKNIRKAFIMGLSDADGAEQSTKVGTWYSEIELCNKQLIEDIKEVWHSIGLCSGKLKSRKREGGHEIEPGRKMPPTESHCVCISECELPKYENVLSVECVGEEDVYDLTVDNESHNFIVNGTPTHNTRAPERRVFYIDVGSLPPFKAEAFMERMKDQFRKKKVATSKTSGLGGASQVEERWHPPSQDEDYWIPMRANSNTRVETLPGAQNLGEIDDAVYFRNKLFTAMNFPKNYMSNEDPNATRITLSAQDVKFARLIERLQSSMESGFWEICNRHLKLRGFPEELYEDLKIKMTPPSDWRELSRAEVITNRITNANNLKGSQLFSDFDIMVDWLKLPPDEAKEKISRLKIQKLEDLKIQILAQNPALLGVGIPGQGEQEIGAEAGGPAPMLGGPEAGGMPPAGPEGAMSAEGPPAAPGAEGEAPPPVAEPPGAAAPGAATTLLPEPSEEEIKKYDLEIQNYSKEKDYEDIDYSEIGT